MAIETKTFTVGPDRYEITQLGALKGRRLYARVGQVAAGALDALTKAEGDGLTLGTVLGALARLLEKADPDFIDELCDTFAETTRVHTKPNEAPKLDRALFDQHFAARPKAIYMWLGVCLQHNFADFLGDGVATNLAGVLARFMPKSPTASTGSSGAS